MEQKVWTVTETVAILREVIEGAFASFWIVGEIGDLTIHRSGHVYLTLKDGKAQLRTVFWRGADQAKALELAAGVKVEAFGSLTVYEARGDCQFSVKAIRPVGLGDLQRRFEELKTRLSAEGLFDESRKKNASSAAKTHRRDHLDRGSRPKGLPKYHRSTLPKNAYHSVPLPRAGKRR